MAHACPANGVCRSGVRVPALVGHTSRAVSAIAPILPSPPPYVRRMLGAVLHPTVAESRVSRHVAMPVLPRSLPSLGLQFPMRQALMFVFFPRFQKASCWVLNTLPLTIPAFICRIWVCCLFRSGRRPVLVASQTQPHCQDGKVRKIRCVAGEVLSRCVALVPVPACTTIRVRHIERAPIATCAHDVHGCMRTPVVCIPCLYHTEKFPRHCLLFTLLVHLSSLAVIFRPPGKIGEGSYGVVIKCRAKVCLLPCACFAVHLSLLCCDPD